MDMQIWERVSTRSCGGVAGKMIALTGVAENDWGQATINITQVGDFKKAPYKYKLTPLPLVTLLVKLGAGVGKI